MGKACISQAIRAFSCFAASWENHPKILLGKERLGWTAASCPWCIKEAREVQGRGPPLCWGRAGRAARTAWDTAEPGAEGTRSTAHAVCWPHSLPGHGGSESKAMQWVLLMFIHSFQCARCRRSTRCKAVPGLPSRATRRVRAMPPAPVPPAAPVPAGMPVGRRVPASSAAPLQRGSPGEPTCTAGLCPYKCK